MATEPMIPRIAQQGDGPAKRPEPKGRQDLGPAGYPPRVTVEIVHKRTEEKRQYLQTELAIDGEAQLLGLVEQVGIVLSEREFPWETLAKLFDAEGQAALDARQLGPDVVKMLGAVVAAVPTAIKDSACIFLGIYQFDADGTRNPDWEREREFLGGALTFTAWVDLVRTFLAQNDYQRLAAPFGEALATGAQIGQLRSNGAGAT